MVEYNQEDSTNTDIKNLSKEEAIKEYEDLLAHFKEQLLHLERTKLRLYHSLRQDGFTDDEAIALMEERFGALGNEFH